MGPTRSGAEFQKKQQEETIPVEETVTPFSPLCNCCREIERSEESKKYEWEDSNYNITMKIEVISIVLSAFAKGGHPPPNVMATVDEFVQTVDRKMLDSRQRKIVCKYENVKKLLK